MNDYLNKNTIFALDSLKLKYPYLENMPELTRFILSII